jgi:DNA-binding MarR family transcriptional regulator
MTDSAMPTPQAKAPDDCGQHVADQLVHIARLVHGAAPDASLTPAQWTALRYFASANRFSRTPSAFSQFHATTRGTASQTVKSLIAMGLLERHVNAADARSTLIEVTQAGRDKLANDPLSDLCRCIDTLPDELRNGFGRALAQIGAALARMRTSPTFGNCGDCGHCDTTDSQGAYCRCTQSMLTQDDMDHLCIDFAPCAPKLG